MLYPAVEDVTTEDPKNTDINYKNCDPMLEK